MTRRTVTLCLATVLAYAAAASGDGVAGGNHYDVRPDRMPANIIVMIGDGAGDNTLRATRYWTGKPLTVDGEGFHEFWMAAHALRGDDGVASCCDPLDQDPESEYDPASNYDATTVPGKRPGTGQVPGARYPRGFAGYEWNRDFRPDSANTMTAMMSGVVTYPGGINVDGAGDAVRTLADASVEGGKKVGVVASVLWHHATPAVAAGAVSTSRNAYHALARQIIADGKVDVLAGPACPEHDDDARPRPTPNYRYIPADLWDALKAGEASTSGGERWTLKRDADAIRALAAGDPPTDDAERLVLVPKIYRTLQQKRTTATDARTTAPGDDPLLAGVPDLTDLTLASLHALKDSQAGFFLMVEGGAVDWAMHSNEMGRMIEEYEDFDRATAAVVAFLEAGTGGHSFDNTLLVVTADHDHLLFGPEGSREFLQPVEDRGPGVVPGHSWLFDHHSNQLVPLYARGPGAARLAEIAVDVDEAAEGGASAGGGRGAYFHQAALGRFLIALADGGTADEAVAAGLTFVSEREAFNTERDARHAGGHTRVEPRGSSEASE